MGAATFSFVMAMSRVYLGAHCLSDALAGALIGTAMALGVAELLQAVWNGRAGPAADAGWIPPDTDERQSETRRGVLHAILEPGGRIRPGQTLGSSPR